MKPASLHRRVRDEHHVGPSDLGCLLAEIERLNLFCRLLRGVIGCGGQL